MKWEVWGHYTDSTTSKVTVSADTKKAALAKGRRLLPKIGRKRVTARSHDEMGWGSFQWLFGRPPK